MKRVWEGLRLTSGYTLINLTLANYLHAATVDYANELNYFYNRFDNNDSSTDLDNLGVLLADSDCDLVVTEDEVRRQIFLGYTHQICCRSRSYIITGFKTLCNRTGRYIYSHSLSIF